MQGGGFLLTYFTTIEKLFPRKPQTYSKEILHNLFHTYQTDAIDNTNLFPNIIVIMDESFSDLERFNSFSSSEPLEPFLHSLRGKATHYMDMYKFRLWVAEPVILSLNFLQEPMHGPIPALHLTILS